MCGPEPEAKPVEERDSYGCAAASNTTKRRLAQARFERVDVTFEDGKTARVGALPAPPDSYWHFIFRVSAGARLRGVAAKGAGIPASVGSASVDFKKPATLGQESEVVPFDPPPAPPAPAEPSLPPAYLMFVTSGVFGGDLGGTTGADQKCDEAAARGELPGKYVAVISTMTRPVATLLPTKRSVINTAGEALPGNSGSMIGSRLYAPVSFDERGQPVEESALVWTGSTPAAADCAGWTSGSPGELGVVGYAHAIRADEWLGDDGPMTCDAKAHLYCISTDVVPY